MSLSSTFSATATRLVAPPAPFTCVRRAGGAGAGWITPTGELDVATAPQLDEALRAALAEVDLVVLDLRQVEFLDSAGVHLIVDATERARAAGRRLVVVRPRPPVDVVFDLTATSTAVDMVDLPPRAVSRRARP